MNNRQTRTSSVGGGGGSGGKGGRRNCGEGRGVGKWGEHMKRRERVWLTQQL